MTTPSKVKVRVISGKTLEEVRAKADDVTLQEYGEQIKSTHLVQHESGFSLVILSTYWIKGGADDSAPAKS